MEPKLYRYMDPRTAEEEYASPDDIEAVKRYLMAWKFYWDGPLEPELRELGDGEPITLYSREEWLLSDDRYKWFSALTDDQQQSLADSHPPEEVPHLERVND